MFSHEIVSFECQKSLHSNSRIRNRTFAENNFVEATWKRHSFYLFWHFYLHQLKIQSRNNSEKTLGPLNSLKSTTFIVLNPTRKQGVVHLLAKSMVCGPNDHSFHLFCQLLDTIWLFFDRIWTQLNQWSILTT